MPSWVDKILSSQTVQFGLGGLAFLIALWLVIVIARMLMGGRLRLPGGRTRQARLGIVDAFDLDRQRQLIIVRRDNTEHLIMIGGPNDLVIESEIVRVEARDFRDTRRDKSVDGPGDGRIPAPLGLPIPDAPQGNGPVLTPRFEEPLLPMPLPQAVETPSPETRPSGPPTSPPQQRPTFPLPPRRPVPPAPDRRPAPPLPDRVSRTEDRPVAPDDVPPAPPALQQVPPRPVPAAAESPSGTVPTLSPDVSARPAPPIRPFLKPLPPRPPMRPLKRVTPQIGTPPTEGPAAAGTGGPAAATPTTQTPPAPPPASEIPPPPPSPVPVPVPETAPTLPHPTDRPAEKDALESLEEEMAKLLGRGS